MEITIDTSEVDRFVVDLGRVPARAQAVLAPVVSKGALNIKQDMQQELRSSGNPGFQHVASTVNYDLKDGGMVAEIGPDKPSGALANIAYFGSYKGGGTREDPGEALAREVPVFSEHVLRAVEGLI